MADIQVSSAYVLHRRPYRETSVLIDVFTPMHGVMSSIVRGAKRGRSTAASILQPFQRLVIQSEIKGEWLNLKQIEADGLAPMLVADRLFSAFYLNELILRALPHHDAHPHLFEDYARTLQALSGNAPLKPLLRAFEKRLLRELGYALPLAGTFDQDGWYRIGMHADMVPAAPNEVGAVSGHSLEALAMEVWDDLHLLSEIQRFLQQLLAQVLGDRPLKTRTWLKQLRLASPMHTYLE